jgi:hypothetical protein
MTQLLTIACAYALVVFMIVGNVGRLSLLVRLCRELDKKNTREAWHLPVFTASRKARPTLL